MKKWDDVDAAGLLNPRLRDGTDRSKLVQMDLSNMTTAHANVVKWNNAGMSDNAIARGELTITTTGAINDLDITTGASTGNIVAASVLRMNNASLATLQGLQGGRAGQQIIILNVGSSLVLLAHQNAGSIASNRLNNLATSAATPLAAGGSAVYEYDATSSFWRLIAHDQGAWITPTFAAGNYTANGAMTWTLQSTDVGTMMYKLYGNTMVVLFSLNTTTVGGTVNNTLLIGNANYGGFSCAANVTVNPVLTFDNNVRSVGLCQPSGTSIPIQLIGQGNFTLATNTTSIYGQVTFPVT